MVNANFLWFFLCTFVRISRRRKMDIDLFSEMVKSLILDNDEVALPGLGTFVSEVMPSTFSDKGYTINPPYRKLYFRQRGTGNATMLAEFYAETNAMDLETSGRILDEFISGLRATLQSKKVVVFPGLGRLRATKENTFFFIADEDLDIYPYGVGLEPVSLKTHEETVDEVARSAAAIKEMKVGKVELVTGPSGTGKGSGEAEVASGEGASEKPAGHALRLKGRGVRSVRRTVRIPLIALACVAGAAALLLGAFVLLSDLAPDFVDSILYTPEELRIINY